ncbi:MAG: hypothetical protein HMLKMBBP_01399 [Planctomycetes bacterium]|nr:hypothetical protein [Planctomycetota bacterium]
MSTKSTFRVAAVAALAAVVVAASPGCAGSGRPSRGPSGGGAHGTDGDVVRTGPSMQGGESGPAPRTTPPNPNWPPSTGSAPSSSSKENAYSVTYVLKVTGMNCPIRCVREVREILEPIPGVQQVVIDQPTGKVTCHCNPGTDPQTLVAAFEGQKYYAAKLAD